MERSKLKIGILTSSRADFGIYLPLLIALKREPQFEISIIAFGSHLSPYNGSSLNEIVDNEFPIVHKINTQLCSDDPNGISSSYGLTVLKFADYWLDSHFDVVFCLGDRYEMSAAVQAGIPFKIKFAHIHGGETTKGALDNIYRHQITLASKYHFTSTDSYSQKVGEILGSPEFVYNIGSLSLVGIDEIEILDEADFRSKYNLDTSDYLLVTFHPETNSDISVTEQCSEIYKALQDISKKVTLVVSLPNTDINGSMVRKVLITLKDLKPKRFVLVENFGKSNYFSAMKYATGMVGNSSSGIIESASLAKNVVNVGSRQEGRISNSNVIHCSFESIEIVNATRKILGLSDYEGNNIYFRKDSVDLLLNFLYRFNEAR